MKSRLIALAALAAVGTAHAMSPTDIEAARGVDLKEVRIFGASAQTPGLLNYMKDICGTSLDIYKNGSSDQWAYSCVTVKDAKVGTAGYAAGTKLLVVKRDAGGSIYGVTPVAAKRAQNSLFVTAANCSAYVAGGTTTCAAAAVVPQIPHAGISDVEPTMHTKAFKVNAVTTYLNMPAGNDDSGNAWTPPPAITALDVGPVGQTTFGLAVSPALYAKLQAVQGTTGVPTIGRAFAAGVLGGFVRGGVAGFANWSSLTGDVADAGKTVTICRRTAGSGTQAVSNLFFLNAGELVDTSLGMLAPVASTTGANTYDNSVAGLQVFEGSGTGNAVSCLTSVNGDSTGYAIGVVTGERDDTATTWKFVKIDGAYPDLGNQAARTGAYPFVYTSSMQWIKAGDATIGLDASMLGFLRHIRANAASVAYLATAPVTPRLMALPSAWTGSCAAPVTANAGTYGSCVERLDFASIYNEAHQIFGLATTKNYKTNSAQALHLVK